MLKTKAVVVTIMFQLFNFIYFLISHLEAWNFEPKKNAYKLTKYPIMQLRTFMD